MQDIKIVKKPQIKTKQQKPKTTVKHVTIYLGVLLTLFFTLGLHGNYLNRTTDYGITWRHGQTSKMAFHTLFVAKEVKEVKTEKKATVEVKKQVTSSVTRYKDLIRKYFPEEPKTMIAIAMEESQLDPNAENYNCRYKISTKGKNKTTVYDSLTHLHIDTAVVAKERLPGYVSTWCRPGHIKYSWSKDSGLFGINSVHMDEKLSPEEQVKLAREIYDTYGKNAWVSYKTGRYLKHVQ